MFKSLLIIALFLISAPPCQALQITFMQKGQVDGTIVTLGNIAKFDEKSEMAQALASQTVAQAPVPGDMICLNSLAIKKQLINSLALPGTIIWNGSPTVTLKRSSIRIGSTKIQQIIAEYLHQNRENLPNADIRFIPGTLPIPFLLPTGKLTYEVIPSNPRILGSSRFSIIFRVDNHVAKNMSVKGRIEALAPVAVATRKLNKGTILLPSTLALAVKDINKISNPGLELSTFIGKKLKRTIRSGTVITPIMVETLPVIRRGERVKIVISSGIMHLSATGIARTDGRPDQMIRVQNTRSNKIIQCRVTAPGLVEITL